jgi:hypothetical protein
VQEAAGLQYSCDLGDERRLHEAALVMALFRPRVRKEQVDCVKAGIGYQRHDVGGVASNDAHVRRARLL